MTVVGYTHVAMEIWGVIFCLISSLCIYITKETGEKGSSLLLKLHLSNALLLLADAFAWSFRGHPGQLGSYIVHISNFLVFIMTHVMLAIFTLYLAKYVGQDTKGKRLWKKGILLLCAVGIGLVILTQFNHLYYYFDGNNYYHRNQWFFLSQLIGIIGMLTNAIVLMRYKSRIGKSRFWAFMFYILLPFLAMILQLFIYGIALLNIAITISVLWMFISLQIERGKKLKAQAERLVVQTEQLVKQEHEINEMQRKIMLSQIQPHFLYNALNTIYHLCEIDVEVAQKGIDDFSEYLRGNLDSLSRNCPVTFEKELKHMQIYLSLEKLRFDEDLKIVYDIQETNFVIPAISIQPLVENAVKYGVGKASGGGTRNHMHMTLKAVQVDGHLENIFRQQMMRQQLRTMKSL